jgi:hypothetical protein
MSHLTRRSFSIRKAIDDGHQRTRKAQEEDCHGGNRQRHLRSAAPTRAVRTFPLSSTCSLMSQRWVLTATPRHATPRHADLPYCAAQHLFNAAWDTAHQSTVERPAGSGLGCTATLRHDALPWCIQTPSPSAWRGEPVYRVHRS